MYPTIYDAVKDLFHISIPFLKLLQSFGFFVAIAFLLCAWVFAKELHRKELLGLLQPTFRKVMIGVKATQGEIALQFFFGFLIGWKLISIPFTKDFSADPRAFMLSMKGNIFIGLAGGAALAFLKWKMSEKKKLAEPIEQEEKVSAADHVGNMTLLAAGFGFLGAKIFHILENFKEFLSDPSKMFFSFSGLTMYGGLILGGAAVLVYAHKKGFGIFHVMDACAPGLMLAYGVGRLGCHVSGDGDWGIVNKSPQPSWLHFLPKWIWAYDYPNNVNGVFNPYTDEHSKEYMMAQVQGMLSGNEVRLVDPVFPTPFYEAFICILLFGIFWMFRKKFSSPGLLFSVYLIANGVERFFIELIRVNTTLFHIGSFRMTQAELIAIVLILLGSYGVYWTKKKNKNIPPLPAT
ncbi:MAG: prolipoprotein diacylglyceryl transferase [Bacteroidetes bacterium]|nr:prolipoprotein diacylglyceryl transferase [Bacteroidota bacterium]